MIGTESPAPRPSSLALWFKDTAGRPWSLALNIAVAKRVRAANLGVDLLDEDLTAVLKRIFSDRILLVDVLFVVANENAEPDKRVSDVDFGRAMAGDAIEEGAIALLHAIRDFTPNPRARARVGKLVDSILEAMATVHDRADKVLDAALARMQEEASGNTSSTSPESPASSPGPTRSEN